MKYIVVCCCDREIERVGVADTTKEATEIMKKNFLEEFIKCGYTEEDFSDCMNGIEFDDRFSFNECEAWLNGNYGQQFDWAILYVD